MNSVGRNICGEGHSDEGSEGNEERVTGSWRKRYPCFKKWQRARMNCVCVLLFCEGKNL